ncbi:MAG: SH3 domain-containing protein [Firmicutes bacterium]|nr:SH3 domain-containing protein [Bacillota bacterium]MBR6798956.1 SH3 domain-containing protein [Bacillota bacterium]
MSTSNIKGSYRIISILTITMMFLTVFAFMPMTDIGKSYAAGETAKVTANLLNVRSGAGTGYSKIGTLKKGKTFTVTGTAKDKSGVKWYKFKYSSKKNGYVSSKYVDIKAPTVTSVSNLKGTVNTKSDPLTVRSGAGSSYKKLGTLAKGKAFTITGKAKDSSGVWWYRFTYSGKNGFVSSKYVKTVSTASTVTKITDTKGTIATKSDPLTIRSGPGASYSRLGTLAKGKTFAITGKAKDKSGVWWYQFNFNGKTAYALSKYVTVKTTTSSSASSSSSSTAKPSGTTGSSETTVNLMGTVNTSSDPLTVRSGPGSSYSSIGTLKKGTTFVITSKAKDSSGKYWYKFDYGDTVGYVSSSYVTTSSAGSSSSAEAVTFKVGTTTAESGVNVRSGAGTSYSVLTVLSKGSVVTVTGSAKASNGKVWYKYKYSSSKSGYICSDYLSVKTITSDKEFEAYMTTQGFPESYKAGLRALHAEHPEWVFKAVKVGYSWKDALDKESVVGRNLVSSSAPTKHRSTASGSYNSKTKKWTRFDGSWYAANSKVIAYYMDPRNFLDESGIYQFMTHSYDSKSQNSNTVAAVIKGSFMQSKKPGGGYSSYSTLISDAGKAAKVNPNVLAAMIIQEQGWNGSSLVSGTYKGYTGYYNFFNIGAYTTSTMNAVQRGLWYAKGSGKGATSYSRPWNTPYKSIKGGAQFYYEEYVSNNQDSYYSKKFNVYNGKSSVGTHQYMTFVAAAASEGNIVKRAYESNSNYPVVFEIPVYNSMPATNCVLP